MKLNYAAASDRGLVRGNNEDSAYAGPHLLALADGMGGHAAGEVASQIMIRHLEPLDADPGDNDMLALLASGADDANHAIAQGVREVPETDGMGTTLTALMFNGSELAMCHVGDSRGYRLRDGQLEQITIDDTYVQSLVDKGELDPSDISTHPQRSMILKAYTGRPVEPTLRMIDAQVGDRYLLCSDGLSDPVTHSTIEQELAQGSPTEAARRLVDLALRSGGPDNVTVVVADIVEGNDPATALPTKPATVGALLGSTFDQPNPDTAAGRAAIALSQHNPGGTQDAPTGREPQVIEPNPAAQQSTPDSIAQPAKNKKLLGVLGILLVLGALIGGGWWATKTIEQRYYVATRDGQIVIENGVDFSVFGKDLHKEYQRACLSKDSELTLIANDADEPCNPFKVDDLKESARASVDSLEGGSYDEVLEQTQRLAKEALPVCVTREATSSKTSTKPSATNSPEDLNTPGENCRQVSK
ncbi:PP2C family protein-serine/threonine phosphatase [Corynebacterium pelargi]|uniref:PP2C-family Ser/Thr phosphatase n=1 Tax=Corynebacterium pelargi TaxID=1471400 RepID=A0A410W629_9CORY|nr:protein phosphatase 2C domain-containing protein [Corynebacterium pelargi]QAU51336.1 PP2C-family Ser/Thr phosphatase [Corynebacterium pelargi]GGG81669.1 protein phosphatase [Corynebacterium pelargi]